MSRKKMYLCRFNRMKRVLRIWIVVALVSAWASLCYGLSVAVMPGVELQADRTVIYPWRMGLMGEETLMDVLQMMPELMISGYEDVITNYNLRIDNVPINGDVRLILGQMKAKDIDKIQLCDNSGVAKGTIGKSEVLDITMFRRDTVNGMAEGQGGFGREQEGNATVNVLYGSERTDLYANASYRYQQGHREYVSLHMTNRFDKRNTLLTYLTQQYLALPDGHSQKIMGRARYFHTFNELGTEVFVLGGYQYATDPTYSTQLPMFVVELNTPFPVEGLTMMAGVEGDYLMTKQKGTDRSWNVFNHDIYLQFSYAMKRWRFTAGHRVMMYNYRLSDSDATQTYFDVRNNTNASIIFEPNLWHQIQLAYYRKYFNPAYETLFMETNTLPILLCNIDSNLERDSV